MNENFKHRILVIGWEVGEQLAVELSSQGFHTTLIPYHGGALPSEEIFSTLSHQRIDLVIVALWNFREVLLEIRQRFPSLKTMFLNSYKTECDEIAIRHGVNVVMRVPFQTDDLLEQIRRIIPP